jgi:hypothetical protein
MLHNHISAHANAIKAYLEHWDGIEPSWDDEQKDYQADVYIAEWHNCREQGYIVYMRNKKREQINIAFFEHRNSDSMCAVKWIQHTLNPPTIDTAEFDDVYKDKWDVSHTESHGQASKMADWIYDQLEAHWKEGAER